MKACPNVEQLAHQATRIRKLHEESRLAAKRSVELIVEIGGLLKQMTKIVQFGDWGTFCESAGISRNTAWRYMRVFDDWDSKAGQLGRGLMVCEVYRSIGLLPELQGGGARLGKDELTKRRQAEQLVFHFDRVEAGIRELSRFKENPLLDHLESLEIGRLQEDCKAAERAAQYYREAVEAKQRTITV